MRRARAERETRETRVSVELDLDGTGVARIKTGIGFFDHLLEAFACHAGFDLKVAARGDVEVDGHHTVEDVGICLGQGLRAALGPGEGIYRWGWCLLPMDDALAEVAVDAGGRAFLAYRVPDPGRSLGLFHSEMAPEFWRALVRESGVTMHVSLRWGENAHHILEAVWKAAGVALGMALRIDPRREGVPSTKSLAHGTPATQGLADGATTAHGREC